MRALRVLIADDEPDVLTTLGMILRGEGAEVRLLSGGLRVPRAVAEFAPDVVILDLALPDHSGLDVARELRQCYGSACPVLVCVTARTGDADRASAAQSGFRHFVAKPCDPRELVRLVLAAPRRGHDAVGQVLPLRPDLSDDARRG